MKRLMLVLVLAGALFGSASALAGTPYTTDDTPTVTVSETDTAPAEVEGVVVENTGDTPDALPFTGSDIVSIAVFGTAVIAAGAAMVARSRRAANAAR